MTLASSFKTRRWALTACAVSALLLAGCASMQTQTPEQIVEARANQRWQYLIEGDIQKAYDMLTDSYRRVTPYERYRGRMANGGWIKAKAISVACADEVCAVRISLEAKPPLGARYGGNINTGLDESWVLEEGQWRIKPQL
ncbi:hypothetical protein [Curvibacter gracilis]|uniref:hypothetical protein n=1 Tax=Curvibacter gracilis TaxID=230310 RepID=UPI0004B974FE|nr:hypothetical protein [Curvibacter gracilis]